MVFVLVLVLVVAPSLAFYLAQDWFERRRRTKAVWSDDGEPLSWRSSRDVFIVLAAGVFLVIGAVGILAVRSAI